jgi:hypothetical protein
LTTRPISITAAVAADEKPKADDSWLPDSSIDQRRDAATRNLSSRLRSHASDCERLGEQRPAWRNDVMVVDMRDAADEIDRLRKEVRRRLICGTP